MEKTAGYITDVPYTHGYYRELSPCFIDFALLLNGFEPPRRSPLRYLELGYGQGLTANIHAAAVPGDYFGADFNPTHASNAQLLAEVSRSPARFSDDSFATLAESNSLPEFDYITLHGVWSWVNPESRNHILAIIAKHLKVGGALYMSYNVLPGWAPVAPLRHMMALHIKLAGSDTQNLNDRINGAIEYTRALAVKNARFFAANPAAKGRLERIAEQNRNYLAHEYFNEDWEPMYSSQVIERLGHNRATFACSASLLDSIDSLNINQEQAQILNSISNPVLKETVRDYLLNSQFRRDLFTRGTRRLTTVENLEKMKQTRLALTTTVDGFDYTLTTGAGKLSLKKEIYEPILEQLTEGNYKPKPIADLAAKLEKGGVVIRSVMEALAILVGLGTVAPAQAEEDCAKAEDSCRRLNAHLIEQSRLSGEVEHLASPVIGGGVHVDRFQQMFLRARAAGKKAPDDWADEAWNCLKAQRQSIIVEGKVLKTDEENLAELRTRAKRLADKTLPVLKMLRVCN